MEDQWQALQMGLQERSLTLETPQAILAWMDQQAQPQERSFGHVIPHFLRLQEQLIELLNVVIADTDAAANSFIHEISNVDTDTERLSNHIKNIEHKTVALQSLREQTTQANLDGYINQLFDNLTTDMDMLRAFSGYVGKVSLNADGVHQAIHRMITVLSFKAIMDAAIAEDKTKSFAQIAGEVRILARQSADQSDEILKFIDEMQIALEQRLSDLNIGLDGSRTQMDVVRDEIQGLLNTHSELKSFLQNTIMVFNEGHNDIWSKIRMMYAQVQFQDIVRQKAERGITLIRSQITALQQCLVGDPIEVVEQQLQSAINLYRDTEQLHVAFHHSGADASHSGGAMAIDLF
jgi:hypothetical protein